MILPVALAAMSFAAASDEDEATPLVRIWRLFMDSDPEVALDMALGSGDLEGGFEVLAFVYQNGVLMRKMYPNYDVRQAVERKFVARFNQELKDKIETPIEKHRVFWCEHALVYSRDVLDEEVEDEGANKWKRQPVRMVPAEDYEEVHPFTTLYIIMFGDGAFGGVSERDNVEHENDEEDWERVRVEVPLALAEAYLSSHPIVGDSYGEWEEFRPYEQEVVYKHEAPVHVVAGDEERGIGVCRGRPLFLQKDGHLDATIRPERKFVEEGDDSGAYWKLAPADEWNEESQPEAFWTHVREWELEPDDEEEDGEDDDEK